MTRMATSCVFPTMTGSLALPQVLSFFGAESERIDAPGFDDLVAAAGGDSGALARLYDSMAAELFGLALWRCRNHGLAEDAVQEVFCRLASGSVGLPRKLESPRAWLFASVRNAVIDLERRSRRLKSFEDSDLELVLARDRSEERREESLALSRAIAGLAPKLREAIFLHAYAGMSFREVGEVVGIPTFTAASRYRLGLRQLRKQLGERS